MAKSPGPGRCVHCLADVSERNWDHVFPKSWYPEGTPSDLEKWKIPSCRPCNKSYGEIEEDLMLRLSCCVDPKSPAAKGVYDQARRAVRPEFATSDRDRAARSARARKLAGFLIEGKDIPPRAVYPGLGERWNRPKGSGLGIFIPAKGIQRLAEKIVRGVTFLEDARFLEPPEKIRFSTPADIEESVKAMLDAVGIEYSRGPGIVVRRAVTPMLTAYDIRIWGEFTMYALVEIGPS